LNALMQYLPVAGRVTLPISFDRVTVQNTGVPLQSAGSIDAYARAVPAGPSGPWGPWMPVLPFGP
jgi:hypothetical protein